MNKQKTTPTWFNILFYSATTVLFILALGCGAGDEPNPNQCAEGDTKQVECNSCTCEADGSWSCTEKACPQPQCSPGDTMDDDCNTCSCNTQGLWLCTQRACEPPKAQAGEACSMHGTKCDANLECAYQCPDPNADPNNCNLGINPSGTCVAQNAQCTTDADCMTSGCSGTICQPASEPATITTCDYRPHYACYKNPTTNCGCHNGTCGWAQTTALQSCLGNGGPN